jgi:hypothetical protein
VNFWDFSKFQPNSKSNFFPIFYSKSVSILKLIPKGKLFHVISFVTSDFFSEILGIKKVTFFIYVIRRCGKSFKFKIRWGLLDPALPLGMAIQVRVSGTIFTLGWHPYPTRIETGTGRAFFPTRG